MIIPERSVDIWTALEVERQFPGSAIWAPTSVDQAASEPWDLDIRTPKLVLIESKGLTNQGRVRIGRKQLDALALLERWLAAGLGPKPIVFFGLPLGGFPGCSSSITGPGHPYRQSLQTQFPARHMMVTPVALKGAVSGNGQELRFGATRLPASAVSLNDLLRQVASCESGHLFEPEENARVRRYLSALFDRTSEHLLEQIKNELGLLYPVDTLVDLLRKRSPRFHAVNYQKR